MNGLISDAGKIVGRAIQDFGLYDASTLKEPYRIEGKKTMGLEIAEQMNWSLPDVILYPTGGGVGIIGIYKALSELKELGWVKGKLPRLVAVQAGQWRYTLFADAPSEERYYIKHINNGYVGSIQNEDISNYGWVPGDKIYSQKSEGKEIFIHVNGKENRGLKEIAETIIKGSDGENTYKCEFNNIQDKMESFKPSSERVTLRYIRDFLNICPQL